MLVVKFKFKEVHPIVYMKEDTIRFFITIKTQHGSAGSASKPKRRCDVLSISEKVKTLDMIVIEENHMRRLPGCIASPTNLPFVKL
jgi:hypothetical protein